MVVAVWKVRRLELGCCWGIISFDGNYLNLNNGLVRTRSVRELNPGVEPEFDDDDDDPRRTACNECLIYFALFFGTWFPFGRNKILSNADCD